MNKYQINTIDGLSFEVDSAQLEALDVIENKDGTFHLILNNRSYNIEVLETDHLKKYYVLNVNEKEVALYIRDELDIAIEKMGFSEQSVSSGGKVFSPMPGLVLSISKKEGDSVQKGEQLLILEAMKMENIIKAPIDGIVSSLQVEEGQTVSKKQLLLEMK